MAKREIILGTICAICITIFTLLMFPTAILFGTSTAFGVGTVLFSKSVSIMIASILTCWSCIGLKVYLDANDKNSNLWY